jgi:hypothetical protein
MSLRFRDATLDDVAVVAGAGAFYARCSFSERGRVVYRGNPLVYYERVVASVPGNP